MLSVMCKRNTAQEEVYVLISGVICDFHFVNGSSVFFVDFNSWL